MEIVNKDPRKIREEIHRIRAQRTGTIGILDSVFEENEKKVHFILSQRRLKIKQGHLKGLTMAEERNEEIERQVKDQVL